jgi:hypothetical protein
MKSELVKRKQPFGEVNQHEPMGGEGKPHAMDYKPLGEYCRVGNNGLDHGPSFADKNPGAHAYASRNMDNPFAWTGCPKMEGVKHSPSVYEIHQGKRK